VEKRTNARASVVSSRNYNRKLIYLKLCQDIAAAHIQTETAPFRLGALLERI
jgi:hypothetical protein